MVRFSALLGRGKAMAAVSYLDSTNSTYSIEKTLTADRLSGGTLICPESNENDPILKKLSEGIKISNKQSIFPCALVSTLFFCWGFAYGLLDCMSKQVQNVMGLKQDRSTLMATGYYGAYLLGPLLMSGPLVRKYGYRVTFVTGLVLFGAGSLCMWPAALFKSLWGLCCAMFVTGLGLSTLEQAANPYVAGCGPSSWAETRLNTAQGFAAFGTVVSPLLASFVLFKDPITEQSQQSTKDAGIQTVVELYRGVGAGVFGLAIVFTIIGFCTNWIPEIEDPEVHLGDGEKPKSGSILKEKRLWWAVIAQFFNLGAQVAVAQGFVNYCVEIVGQSDKMGGIYMAVAQGLFCVSRFAAAAAMRFIKPRVLLLITVVGCIVSTLGSVLAPWTSSKFGLASLCLIMFFEAPTFPTIFATAEQGLGHHHKLGGTFLVSAVSGGGLQPFVLGHVAHTTGRTNMGYIVPLVAFVAELSYPLYLNLDKKSKMELDQYYQEEREKRDEENVVSIS